MEDTNKCFDYDQYSDDKIITFKVKGNLFYDGFDLNITLNILKDFQYIMDKAYLTLVNKKKISEKDRELYKIKAINSKDKSLILDLQIYIGSTMQAAMPILSSYSPKQMWDLVKNGYDFISNITKARKQGKSVNIKQNKNIDKINVEIQGDEKDIIIDKNTYIFSNKAYDDYNKLSNYIDDENVEEISIYEKDFSENANIINFDVNKKEIFKYKSRIYENILNFKGRIFRIDVDNKKGKIDILESKEKSIPLNQYNFKVLDDKDIKECCNYINKPTEFTALKKIIENPFLGEEKIECLVITKING